MLSKHRKVSAGDGPGMLRSSPLTGVVMFGNMFSNQSAGPILRAVSERRRWGYLWVAAGAGLGLFGSSSWFLARVAWPLVIILDNHESLERNRMEFVDR
jgi:hypothetical protein